MKEIRSLADDGNETQLSLFTNQAPSCGPCSDNDLQVDHPNKDTKWRKLCIHILILYFVFLHMQWNPSNADT